VKGRAGGIREGPKDREGEEGWARRVGEDRDYWEIVEKAGKNWKSRGRGWDEGGAEVWGRVEGIEEGRMDGEG
jgi:hypothetical protein